MSNFKNVVEAVTLLKREDGSHLIPIRQYYIDKIARLGPDYRVSIPDVGKGLGLCPLHDDLKPSMGILKGKDGRERYNCFGCQSFGHVVDLHLRMEQLYKKRRLSRDVAAYELLAMYGIDRGWVDSLIGTRAPTEASTEAGIETTLQRRTRLAREIQNSFTDEDYRKAVVGGVLEDKPLAYFNTLMHIRTSTMPRSE